MPKLETVVDATVIAEIAGVEKLGDDGTAGATEDIVKFDIAGGGPNTIDGFVYAGAKLEGSAITCADIDGATGTTAEIDKSKIVGVAPRDIRGFEYVGAVPVIDTEEVSITGLEGATDDIDNVLGLNEGNV